MSDQLRVETIIRYSPSPGKQEVGPCNFHVPDPEDETLAGVSSGLGDWKRGDVGLPRSRWL